MKYELDKIEDEIENRQSSQHLGTITLIEDTRQNITTQKTIKINNADLTINPGVNPGAREGYAAPTTHQR